MRWDKIAGQNACLLLIAKCYGCFGGCREIEWKAAMNKYHWITYCVLRTRSKNYIVMTLRKTIIGETSLAANTRKQQIYRHSNSYRANNEATGFMAYVQYNHWCLPCYERKPASYLKRHEVSTGYGPFCFWINSTEKSLLIAAQLSSTAAKKRRLGPPPVQLSRCVVCSGWWSTYVRSAGIVELPVSLSLELAVVAVLAYVNLWCANVPW